MLRVVGRQRPRQGGAAVPDPALPPGGRTPPTRPAQQCTPPPRSAAPQQQAWACLRAAAPPAPLPWRRSGRSPTPRGAPATSSPASTCAMHWACLTLRTSPSMVRRRQPRNRPCCIQRPVTLTRLRAVGQRSAVSMPWRRRFPSRRRCSTPHPSPVSNSLRPLTPRRHEAPDVAGDQEPAVPAAPRGPALPGARRDAAPNHGR